MHYSLSRYRVQEKGSALLQVKSTILAAFSDKILRFFAASMSWRKLHIVVHTYYILRKDGVQVRLLHYI